MPRAASPIMPKCSAASHYAIRLLFRPEVSMPPGLRWCPSRPRAKTPGRYSPPAMRGWVCQASLKHDHFRNKAGRGILRPTCPIGVQEDPRSFFPERLGEAVLERPDQIGESRTLSGGDQNVGLHAGLDLLGDIFRHGVVVDDDLCREIRLL